MLRKQTNLPPLSAVGRAVPTSTVHTRLHVTQTHRQSNMVGDGDESDPSVKWRGRSVDVAEAFEFPFESPPGGCLLRYNFLVQDGYELGFSMRCAIFLALEGTSPG